MSYKGKAGLAALLLGVVTSTVFGAGSANAAGDQWASIAVSDNEPFYGISVNVGSVEEAESIAIADCHVADCRAVLTWANGCGVLVESNDALAWASGPTRADAEREAYATLAEWTPTAMLANTGSANLSGAHVVDAICTSNAA
ncbi:DUF4189 domain-containing protein [Nocardia sp. NPDC059177]|uniref:DUF4189 domain-containing protein n=1 Tax=Nocardia sp. NPDC059177 TaxID=3346759 RepID=UPI00367BC869